MRYLVTIDKQTITRIKELLQSNGIRESARRAEVSYYTAWCVSKGKYDNDQPLQENNNIYAQRCPITGFLIDSRPARVRDTQPV